MHNLRKISFTNKNKTMEIIVDENNNPWLTKTQIAELYGKDRSSISRQVDSILKILDKTILESKNNPVRAKFAHTENDGKTYKFYHYSSKILQSLDTRLSVNLGSDLIEYLNVEKKRNLMTFNGEIIIYDNDNVNIEVTVVPKDNTVYLTKEKLVTLFQTTRQNIEYHLGNIYESKELIKDQTCKEILQVQNEGGKQVTRCFDYYNLDVIISLGYRINTKRGIAFRIWATDIIKKYLLQGYAINQNQVTLNKDYFIKLDNDVETLKQGYSELKDKVDRYIPKGKLIYEGEVFEGYTFINNLIRSATKQVILIDGYAEDAILPFFKGARVRRIVIITHKLSRFSESVVDRFEKEQTYVGLIENKSFHDRYLIIDDKTYLLGTSLNEIGKKTSGVFLYEDFPPDKLLLILFNMNIDEL